MSTAFTSFPWHDSIYRFNATEMTEEEEVEEEEEEDDASVMQ